MADDDSGDEDDNKWQELALSLQKGYHQTEVMVYTRQHMGDISDSSGCKQQAEDRTDGGETDL